MYLGESGSDFCGDWFSFFFASVMMGHEFKTITLEAGNHMNVDVIDHLTRVFAVVHVDIDAVGARSFFDGVRDYAYCFLYLPPQFWSRFKNIRRMLFGNDERVTGVHRFYRENRHRRIILENLDRRQFAPDDFAENTIGHGGSITNCLGMVG